MRCWKYHKDVLFVPREEKKKSVWVFVCECERERERNITKSQAQYFQGMLNESKLNAL